MGGSLIPGPVCATRSSPIDWGTSPRMCMPDPRPMCLIPVPVQRQWHNQSVAGGFDPQLLKVSPDGVKLLKGVEELHLLPYDDQTSQDITAWVAGATIGYGHLIAKGDWDKYKGGFTEADADALFEADLAPFETEVGNDITTWLQQYEFDALVILAFNIGKKGFRNSSVVKLVNDPKAVTAYTSLEAAWKSWNKSQGKVMKGLDNRRNAEWKIYTMALYERW